MVKILLVDNNPVTRQYIAHAIDWLAFGAEIVGEASDGKEAFYLAVKHAPDIIITEIELPICDGMELIANLREIHSPAKILIFTDARNEEYLLSAIKLGVTEYLFKQANISYVKVAAKKLCDQIAEEQVFQTGIQEQKSLFQKYLREIQSDCMNRILRDKTAGLCRNEEAEQLHLYLHGPCYQILLFHCDPNRYWNVLAYIEQYSQEFHPCVWRTEHKDLYAVLLNLQRENDSQSFLLHFTAQYKNMLQDNGRNILLTPVAEDFRELSAQYLTGLRLAECQMLFPDGELLTTQEWTAAAISGITRRLGREKQLLQGLKTVGSQDYEKLAWDYIRELRASLCTDAETRNSLYRILFAVAVRENLLLSSLEQRLREIQSISSVERLWRFLETLYQEMGLSTEYNGTLIRNVKRHIEENYAKKISLNSIAKLNFVSASYLSSLFHKETGVSFNQWLQQYRIEQAKTLLSSGRYKNYEIAVMVGFSDYKAFAKYFSRYTGKNAKEYKRQFVLLAKPEEKEPSAEEGASQGQQVQS